MTEVTTNKIKWVACFILMIGGAFIAAMGVGHNSWSLFIVGGMVCMLFMHLTFTTGGGWE
jgi:hypothetical protein